MMLLSTGSHGIVVDFTIPVIILIVVFSSTSIFLVCALLIHTAAAYSATEYTKAKDDVRRVLVGAPHVIPANLCMMFLLARTLEAVFSICFQ